MSSFLRPFGAAVDLAELEYIAALMQTCVPNVRTNGTISTADVQILLKSRFGFVVNYEDALRIVRGLGGGVIGDDVIQLILEQEQERKQHEQRQQLEEQLRTEETIRTRTARARWTRLTIARRMQEGMFRKRRQGLVVSDFEQEEEEARIDVKASSNSRRISFQRFRKEHQVRKEHPRIDRTTDHTSDKPDIEESSPESAGQNHLIPSGETDNAKPDSEPRSDVNDHQPPKMSISEPKKNENDTSSTSQKEPAISAENDEPLEYLDTVQLTAILLMPTLARAAKAWKSSNLATEASIRNQQEASNNKQNDDDNNNEDDDKNSKDDEDEGLNATNWSIPRWIEQNRKEDVARFITLKKELLPPMVFSQAFYIMINALEEIPSGSIQGKTIFVTRELVQSMLLVHGEKERASDRILVDKMVEAVGGEGNEFTVDSFVNALTNDLSQWRVGAEDEATTSMYDVFGYESIPEQMSLEGTHEAKDLGRQLQRQREGANEPTTRTWDATPVYTAMNVDFTIDNHSSLLAIVFIWAFFISCSSHYMSLILTVGAASNAGIGCSPSFRCTLLGTIYSWLVFAGLLTLFGFVVVFPLTVGNVPTQRTIPRTLFAFVTATIFTVLPYSVLGWHLETVEETDPTEDIVSNPTWDVRYLSTLFIGIFLMVLIFIEFALAIIGEKRIRSSYILKTFFAASSIRGATNQKRAATRKLNGMLGTALELHPSRYISDIVTPSSDALMNDSSGLLAKNATVDETMLNYVLRGYYEEEWGGLLQTWRAWISNDLFDKEGIWFSTRLVIIQVAQVIVIAFYIAFLRIGIEAIAAKADEASEGLLTQYKVLPLWVYDFVPTGFQVRVALYPAMVAAVGVSICLFIIYIPSYVTTILKYRTGCIPSLKSLHFSKYRKQVESVYLNVGNAVYGMIGAGALFFFLVGAIVFLFIWPFTRNLMFILSAWLLGLVVTITLKTIITKASNYNFYSGFYRTNPAGANLTTLALESWALALGGGTLVGRISQFLFAAAFWTGRIDEPFLSDNVNLFGYAFDLVPTNFMKELLIHEAHRHPYIERIAAMYIMKLTHDDFCSDEGACWRQLFVTALMPWLQKNRVFSDARLKESAEAYNQHRSMLERKMEPKTFMSRAKNELKDGFQDIADQIIDERPSQFIAPNAKGTS